MLGEYAPHKPDMFEQFWPPNGIVTLTVIAHDVRIA